MLMLRLLRAHPAFRRLWIAGAVSLVGDWLSLVAVALLALDGDGGARSLAIVLAVHALPQALFAPVAGVIADRFDRRRVLLAAPLAQAALTLLMAAAAVHRSIIAVQALVLARSLVGAFVVTAETAALRRTVPEEELLRANSLVSGTWSVTYVAGMALGGALAALGPATAMTIDALTFLVAAALLRGLPKMVPEVAARTRATGIVATFAGDLAAAYRYAAERPALFRKVFGKAPLALAGGAGWLVLHLVAGEIHPLGTAAISLGVLQAVRGAGTGIGPAITSALPRRYGDAIDHAVAATTFVSIALFPLATSVVLFLAIALAWGMGIGANWVLSSAGVQQHASDGLIGRLASLDELATTAAMVSGALIAAEVVTRAGSPIAAAWLGASLGAATWWWLGRSSATPREAAATPV
jgi:MFS family permease